MINRGTVACHRIRVMLVGTDAHNAGMCVDKGWVSSFIPLRVLMIMIR